MRSSGMDVVRAKKSDMKLAVGGLVHKYLAHNHDDDQMTEDVDEVVKSYFKSKDDFEKVKDNRLKMLDIPTRKHIVMHKEEDMITAVQNIDPDIALVRATNTAFLSIVRSQYWHQIEAGEFIDGSSHPEVLLSSVAIGMQSAHRGLHDFAAVTQELGLTEWRPEDTIQDCERNSLQLDSLDGAEASLSTKSFNLRRVDSAHSVSSKATRAIQDVLSMTVRKSFHEDDNTARAPQRENLTLVMRVIESTAFNGILMCFILLNVVLVFVQEGMKDEKEYETEKLAKDACNADQYCTGYIQDSKGTWVMQRDEHAEMWFILEVLFTAVFFGEMVIKLIGFKWAYFKQAWNIFDFVLVQLGIVGIVVDAMQVQQQGGFDASSGRVLRLNKIFRVMRFMRVFRLVKFIQVLKHKLAGNQISLELAKHLRKISILTAFIKAHKNAQVRLMTYFGDYRKRGVEQARCLLESQTAVHMALCMASSEVTKVERSILEWLNILRESGRVADELKNFICGAQQVGVVSSREADALLEPLHERRRNWYLLLRESEMGIVRRHRSAGTESVHSAAGFYMTEPPATPSGFWGMHSPKHMFAWTQGFKSGNAHHDGASLREAADPENNENDEDWRRETMSYDARASAMVTGDIGPMTRGSSRSNPSSDGNSLPPPAPHGGSKSMTSVPESPATSATDDENLMEDRDPNETDFIPPGASRTSVPDADEVIPSYDSCVLGERGPIEGEESQPPSKYSSEASQPPRS
jgi:hypothetical protein